MRTSEREDLIQSMSGEMSAGPWTLVGCVCGLGAIVFVAAVFGSAPTSALEASIAAAQTRPANETTARSDEHRKMVFDDRRAVAVRAPGPTRALEK